MRLDPETSASTEREACESKRTCDGPGVGLAPWDGEAGDPTDGGPREHETSSDPWRWGDAKSGQHLEAHR